MLKILGQLAGLKLFCTGLVGTAKASLAVWRGDACGISHTGKDPRVRAKSWDEVHL